MEAGTIKRLAGKLLACTCQLHEVKPRRTGASQDLFQSRQPQCTELFEIIIQPVGYVPSSILYCVQVSTRAARNWYRQGTEPHCTTSSLSIAKQLLSSPRVNILLPSLYSAKLTKSLDRYAEALQLHTWICYHDSSYLVGLTMSDRDRRG